MPLSSLSLHQVLPSPPTARYQHKQPERFLLTHKLDQLTLLLTSFSLFLSHSVYKPKSSPRPTRTCVICPQKPPTLISSHSRSPDTSCPGSSLLLEHFRQVSTSGPLHLEFPMPGMLFSVRFLIFKTLHQYPLAPYLQCQHFKHSLSSFFSLVVFLCPCHFLAN